MTATAETPIGSDSKTTGRRAHRIGPIGRFVLVVAALSAALGVIAWSGAATPRIHADQERMALSSQPGFAYQVVEVVNRATLPVDIGAATWPTTGLSDPQLRLGALGRPPWTSASDGLEEFQTSVPFEPFRLEGGGRRTVIVTGWIRCAPGQTEIMVTTADLEVSAEPPLGPERAVVLEVGWTGTTLPCPAAPA